MITGAKPFRGRPARWLGTRSGPNKHRSEEPNSWRNDRHPFADAGSVRRDSQNDYSNFEYRMEYIILWNFIQGKEYYKVFE